MKASHWCTARVSGHFDFAFEGQAKGLTCREASFLGGEDVCFPLECPPAVPSLGWARGWGWDVVGLQACPYVTLQPHLIYRGAEATILGLST